MRIPMIALATFIPMLAIACTPDQRAAAVTTPAPAPASNHASRLVLHAPRTGLYSAGQPEVSDWTDIAARGISTVINLRPTSEMQGRDEAAEVRAAGLRYLEIPIADGAAITPDSARKLSEAIRSADGAPVLVHCASANRAGGLLAVMAAKEEGMAAADALAFGRAAGMKGTEARVREVLAGD